VNKIIRKGKFIPLDEIEKITLLFQVDSLSWGISMTPAIEFELKDGKLIRGMFSVTKIEQVYYEFGNTDWFDKKSEKKRIKEEYDELLTSYRSKLLLREIVTVILMLVAGLGTFGLYAMEEGLGNSSENLKVLFIALFIGIVTGMLAYIMFALISGRNNHAIYNSLVLRASFYNRYFAHNKKKRIKLDPTDYTKCGRRTFMSTGIILIILGCTTSFVGFYFGVTSQPNLLLAGLAGLLCIGMGFAFSKLFLRKPDIPEE